MLHSTEGSTRTEGQSQKIEVRTVTVHAKLYKLIAELYDNPSLAPPYHPSLAQARPGRYAQRVGLRGARSRTEFYCKNMPMFLLEILERRDGAEASVRTHTSAASVH